MFSFLSHLFFIFSLKLKPYVDGGGKTFNWNLNKNVTGSEKDEVQSKQKSLILVLYTLIYYAHYAYL